MEGAPIPSNELYNQLLYNYRINYYTINYIAMQLSYQLHYIAVRQSSFVISSRSSPDCTFAHSNQSRGYSNGNVELEFHVISDDVVC